MTGLETTPSPGPVAAVISLDGDEHRLAACWSGDRESFLGVDMADESRDLLLRLVIDPMEGPRLRLMRGPGAAGRGMAFDTSGCRELQAQVRPTGWRVNRVRDFTGELRADCTSEQGAHLVAHLAFSHCH